jgi:hypothetical protein
MSDDQKYLTVKFFWLLKGSDHRFAKLCSAPSVEGYDQGPGYARLFNHETTDPVRSGDEIHLRTEDSVGQRRIRFFLKDHSPSWLSSSPTS